MTAAFWSALMIAAGLSMIVLGTAYHLATP